MSEQLRESAQKLLDACFWRDGDEELFYSINGSLLKALSAAIAQPAQPRAWLLEPKVQRHPGREVHYGVSTLRPDAEMIEYAEVDGCKYTPLYPAAPQAAQPAQEPVAPSGLPFEEALKRAYYFDDAGKWRDCETVDWDRWHAVAKAALTAAAPPQAAPVDEAQWAGAVTFLTMVQGIADPDGEPWGDQFLAWYRADAWFGEHRGCAVWLGLRMKAAAQAAPAEPTTALMAAGALMANTMFNLAQHEGRILDKHDCALFKQMQTGWDTAARHSNADAAPTRTDGPNP